MCLNKPIFFFALLLSYFSYGQGNSLKTVEIDKLVARIDSIETSAINIRHFIVVKYSDSDTTRLYNRYILDTIKRDFYKCVYDCSFRGLEQISFYFIAGNLIKTVVNVKEHNEEPFSAIYYFEKGITIYKNESKSSNPPWDIDSIKAQAKQYLDDMAGIITYLDKRKS